MKQTVVQNTRGVDFFTVRWDGSEVGRRHPYGEVGFAYGLHTPPPRPKAAAVLQGQMYEHQRHATEPLAPKPAISPSGTILHYISAA